MLPVTGKFVSFFLIPIYTRIFSSYEFGIIELIITFVHFAIFACNLEFYGAIGRFFHERVSLEKKRELISTGLFLTLFFTFLTSIIIYLGEDIIIEKYLDGGEYRNLLRLGIVWMIFSAIYTYLGVIPRYDDKPKLYVIINASAIIIRVASTICYVLVFKTGIAGVLYGHITGALSATIMNGIVTAKYLGLFFNFREVKAISKYAMPLVPGLLLIGLWNPLSRNIISQFFSVATLGLFSFAIRITSVLQILQKSIHLSWNPMVFENYKNNNFNKEVTKISKFAGLIVFYALIVLTLISPEISLYVGTEEYAESYILIGFLGVRGIFEILKRLRGFGPLLEKKTYIMTITEIIGITIGLSLLFIFKNKYGLIGIGLAFSLPSILKYFMLVTYTQTKYKVKFHNINEYILMGLVVVSIVTVVINENIFFRYSLLIAISIIVIYMYRESISQFIKNRGKSF